MRIAWLALALACGAASAAEYTPAELRGMVAAGDFPAQGTPTSQSQDMDFDSCVAKVRGVLDAIGDDYPTKLIVSTGVMFAKKAWTNDAAMTFTCSQPDRKLVITTARYKWD